MPTKFQTDRQRRPDPYKSWAPPSVYDPRQVESGGSSSLRDTPLREDEPAPPRGAVMAAGSGLVRPGPRDPAYLDLGGAAGRAFDAILPPPPPGGFPQEQYNPTRPAPARPNPAAVAAGAALTPLGPNPGKEKAKEDTQSIATATVMADAQGEGPRGQANNQTLPAESVYRQFVPGGVGTGAGATAQTPPRTTAGGTVPGPSPLFVKLEDGRVISGNNLTPYLQAGGHNISFQDAMARPDKPEMALGKPQADRFMRGRTSRMTETPQDRFSSSPYSEQVRALASAAEASPETSLSFAGDTNFGTSGDRRLSGLEQAIARRTWLEGRADTEQQQESARAETDRRTRLAEMDPLEMARIQAQGRMGGDVAKVELDLRARQAAKGEYEKIGSQIELMMDRLKAAAPGSEDAAQAKQYIDYLIQTRRELSNIILGERLTDPRGVGDALGAAFAGLGLAGGGAAPTSGAR